MTQITDGRATWGIVARAGLVNPAGAAGTSILDIRDDSRQVIFITVYYN
jgi:hypothetical protein